MSDLQKSAFVSDLHFGDKRVLKFERHQFGSIEEHDKFLYDTLISWSLKHKGWTLYILGDFGYVDKTCDLITEIRENYVNVIGVKGNHDKSEDCREIMFCCDDFYYYPTYISKRVMICHEPKYPCPKGDIIIHGHLHGMKIAEPNYVNTSINVIKYKPVTYKHIAKRLGNLDKPKSKFLYEPYADSLYLTQKNPDAVTILGKDTGLVDVKRSRG